MGFAQQRKNEWARCRYLNKVYRLVCSIIQNTHLRWLQWKKRCGRERIIAMHVKLSKVVFLDTMKIGETVSDECHSNVPYNRNKSQNQKLLILADCKANTRNTDLTYALHFCNCENGVCSAGTGCGRINFSCNEKMVLGRAKMCETVYFKSLTLYR